MCRSTVSAAARPVLGRLIDDLARALADQLGVSRDDVAIGPVDFGPPTIPDPTGEEISAR